MSEEQPADPIQLHTAFTDAAAAQGTEAPIETPTPESAPETHPVETQAPPPESSLQDYAREAGVSLDGDFDSDAEYGRALIQYYQQQQQYADFGRQMAPHAEKITAALQSPSEPAAVVEPEEEEFSSEKYFADRWSVPDRNPNWDHLVNSGRIEKNESGYYVPNPDITVQEAMAIGGELQSINEWEAARVGVIQDTFHKGNMFQNFWEVFQEPLNNMLQERDKQWEQKIDERFGQRDYQHHISDFENANEGWIYDGQQTELVNGQMQRKLTPQGRSFINSYTDLVDSGTSREKAMEYAQRLNSSQQAAAPPTPDAPAAQAASEQQTQSFMDTALERASHTPSSGGSPPTNPETDPVNLTKTELHNMFRNAYRAGAA